MSRRARAYLRQFNFRGYFTSYAGYLTRDSVELQELAANSDRLISTLVEYLHNRPDENDDLVQDKDFQLYDQLRKVSIH